MTLLTFTVAGLPVPQGSSRAFVRGGRAVVTSANAHLKPWRAAVTAEAAEARGDEPTIRHAAYVLLHFRFPRPSGHYTGKGALRKGAPEFPATRPDLDKLCRAVLDALTDAGVLADDSLVVELTATKDYSDKPGVSVTVGGA